MPRVIIYISFPQSVAFLRIDCSVLTPQLPMFPQSKGLELGAPCFQFVIYKDPWASQKKIQYAFSGDNDIKKTNIYIYFFYI